MSTHWIIRLRRAIPWTLLERPWPLTSTDTHPIPDTQGSRSPLDSYNANNTILGICKAGVNHHDDPLPRTPTPGDTRSRPHHPRRAFRQSVSDSSTSHSSQPGIGMYLTMPNTAEDISKGSGRGPRWDNLRVVLLGPVAQSVLQAAHLRESKRLKGDIWRTRLMTPPFTCSRAVECINVLHSRNNPCFPHALFHTT